MKRMAAALRTAFVVIGVALVALVLAVALSFLINPPNEAELTPPHGTHPRLP